MPSIINTIILAASAAAAMPLSSVTNYSSSTIGTNSTLDKRWDCFCEYVGGVQDMREWSDLPDNSAHPWAMMESAWDSCRCGEWCQYSCTPGFLPAHWDENPNLSAAEKRAHGGLYCDPKGGGTLVKPRKDDKGKARRYCVDRRNDDLLQFKTSLDPMREHWLCQTILPGSELPLQALPIGSPAHFDLPLPDSSTFRDPDTGAPAPLHFYVNNPGVAKEAACTLGDLNAPDGRGIYAPFVLEVRADEALQRINVTLAWNPIFLEEGWPRHFQRPSFGLRTTCQQFDEFPDACLNVFCRLEPEARWDGEVGYNVVKGGYGTVIDTDERGWQSCTTSLGNGAHFVIDAFPVASEN